MLTKLTTVQKTAWLLLFGLFTTYLALAPGTAAGRGYVTEDMNAGLGVLASFNAWVKGRPVPPITWTRHGPVPLLLDLPFIKLGKLYATPDFAISLQPILLTAALLTVLYLWLTKLCTPGMSLLLTLIAAFGTMLWPYAYIGLETKQSFFVLFAGYLGLANGKIRRGPRLLLFSAMCALAINSKSTGLVLAPPIAYLVYVQFRHEWHSRWRQALAVILIIAGVWALGAAGWSFFWEKIGGGAQALYDWTATSVFQPFMNLLGLFGSPGKGLFIFAPVLLLIIYAIPRAFRTHKELTIFALLVTGCTASFLSMLVVFGDELWGPRLMHVVVAPLIVVIGATCPRFQWRRHLPLLVLGTLGLAISFLGAFYWYGARGWAAEATAQNTLEWYAGDRVWNEVQFDALLFSVWLKGGTDPVPWTPLHYWVWTPPKDAPPPKTVNLRDYADPQSFLLYYWNRPIKESELFIFNVCWIALIVGPLLLAWVIARTIKMTQVRTVIRDPVLTLIEPNSRR